MVSLEKKYFVNSAQCGKSKNLLLLTHEIFRQTNLHYLLVTTLISQNFSEKQSQ